MIGRPLNEAELRSYRHLDRAIATRVRVIEVPALPGGYVGMTLRNVVLLSEDVTDDGESSLLAHELVHVRQWHEQGRLRFLWSYVSAFVRALPTTRSWRESYRAIPAEAEARLDTARWARSRNDR